MKPNPFLYALEFTRHALLVWSLFVVIPSLGSVIFLKVSLLTIGVGVLITYLFVSLMLFMVAFVAANYLVFVVTDERVIVRSSFCRTTTDRLSIAIEAVRRIEINSYGATYGSVYLRHDTKGSQLGYWQPGAARHAPNQLTGSLPIERISSIWGPMDTWPRLLGFYGFKDFDAFANILSEQQRLRSELQGARSW